MERVSGFCCKQKGGLGPPTNEWHLRILLELFKYTSENPDQSDGLCWKLRLTKATLIEELVY